MLFPIILILFSLHSYISSFTSIPHPQAPHLAFSSFAGEYSSLKYYEPKYVDKEIVNDMMAEQPTSHQALEALRVVIRYAEANFDPQDADLFIHLGRMDERLVRRQKEKSFMDSQQRERDFMNICARTGFHGVNRE